jgi:hypothetical protein
MKQFCTINTDNAKAPAFRLETLLDSYKQNAGISHCNSHGFLGKGIFSPGGQPDSSYPRFIASELEGES